MLDTKSGICYSCYMNSKHNPMTSDQKQALRMMSDRNIGAMVTRFGWTWPETVRNNEDAAGEVIRILGAEVV